MTCRGLVHGGVVIPEAGVVLPEGAAVRIELDPAAAIVRREEADGLFQMDELAVETGIPDLATNADHYLYGHPKVTDAR